MRYRQCLEEQMISASDQLPLREMRQMTVADRLSGLHMLVSVTQDSLNYQFSELFERGIIHKNLDIVLGDTGLELHARLASPMVSFSVPTNRRAAVLTVRMPSGTFVYWTGVGPKAVKNTIEFADWSYAFQVSLDLRTIEQEALKASAAVPPEVKAHLQNFSSDMFTVRHLFMDFQNANLAAFDPNRTRMAFPDGKPLSAGQLTQFQNMLQTYFATLRGTDNPYVLGYAIHPTPSTSAATFIPTGSTFSTYDDPKSEGMNALNFLLMTQHADLPSDPKAGLFDFNWVTSRDYDGRFVIASRMFWDRWFLPILRDALWLGDAASAAQGWTFSRHTEDKRTEVDAVNCISALTKVDNHVTMTNDRSAVVSFKNAGPSSVEIALSGRLQMTYRADFQCILPEWMSETATIDWTGKVVLTAGRDGQVSMALTVTVPAASKVTDGNWLGKGDIGVIPKNQEVLNGVGQSFEDSMKRALGNVTDAFKALNSRFLMPAGDVFFFKNIQTDDAGNLLFDVAYKAEHPAEAGV
jgi:hypothetical protein